MSDTSLVFILFFTIAILLSLAILHFILQIRLECRESYLSLSKDNAEIERELYKISLHEIPKIKKVLEDIQSHLVEKPSEE